MMRLPDKYAASKLTEFRRSLAHIDALPQLSCLALIVGACTGLIVVLFRLAIETPFTFFDMAHAENFETLPVSTRMILIMCGAAVIGLLLQNLDKYQRQMSVGHVIDRLHNHQGNLPTPNWIAQFVLAIATVTSGQSAGREGPAVHLGAGSASLIGRWLRLPKNSMQTMIACGVAAAIAASFDTPLAGVIFAMEVIVMEYSIVGFVPVILASVIGSAVCKSLLGEAAVFDVGPSNMGSLIELGFIVIAGFIISLLAGTYIKLHLASLKVSRVPIFLRALFAGILTCAVATFIPEVMGLGYDTIQYTFAGKLAIGSLIFIAAGKLFLAPVVVGLGIPGGLIGPSIFVGACTGAVMGLSVQALFPNLDISPNLYILLGMTGMMAAVINAPLAALVAVLELSHNPDIIFPAMLMIVVACLNTRVIFGVRSIFIEQLAATGRDIEMGAASRALRRAGVMSIMDRRFVLSKSHLDLSEAENTLASQANWLVFAEEDRLYAIWAPDLANFLTEAPESVRQGETQIHLLEVPGRRHMLHPILDSDSLYGALKVIKKSHCEVLYVTSNILSQESVHGLVTLDSIQNYYQPKDSKDVMG